MSQLLFQTTDWNSVPVTQRPGETGFATCRVLEFEGFRVRLVEYSANYKAGHWCSTGHIVYCLQGELVSELSDGRTFRLSTGMSYAVSDNASQHRSATNNGAKLLIVDGEFLSEKKPVINPWKM